jgi:endonuclease III
MISTHRVSQRRNQQKMTGPDNQPIRADSPAEERLPQIVERLRRAHPDAHCALDYTNNLELLVATILSAQCTDERVNQVTPPLFARYRDAAAFAAAELSELEEAIRPTGFYRQKARYIKESCRRLMAHHSGQVPSDMDQLLALPGVARKTANVVLGEAFGVAKGVVVDTHVKRLARRLGLSQAKDPARIERELMRLLPRSGWIEVSHLLIFHGRRVCQARRPECPRCPLVDLCPSAVL